MENTAGKKLTETKRELLRWTNNTTTPTISRYAMPVLPAPKSNHPTSKTVPSM